LIGVRGRLRKPSKRTSLIVAIILGIVVAGFTIGSSFGDDEIVNHLSFAGEAASEPDYQRVIADGADASSAAIASDSAKAASGLSSLWIWPSVAVPGGLGEVEQASSAEAFAERMVVFTAMIELEVGDVDSTLDDIRALTEDYGGFIASVNTRSGTGAITIRVPQASFYYAVSEVEGLGEVQTRDLKGEDVTEDFVDLQARLRNLESQEGRLNEILAMGTTVEEVLKVEKELERVRGGIEGLTGEIQYLESRVELATITVLLNVSAELKAEWLPKVDWRAPVTAGLGALFTILQGLLSIAIVLGPFVAIGVPVYYVYKRVNGTRTSS
jgi:hypothetical protein